VSRKISLELNSIDLLKHVLYKDYSFPKELSDFNITKERILMTVKNSNQLPMVTIARAIGLEKGPFSQIVDQLESLELLERVRSTEDKRLVYLNLTEKGNALTKIIDDSMENHFKEKLSSLKPEQVEAFFDALSTLKNTANLLINK
jgi:DNA-binding MarR family transcriptional regulator